MSSEKTFAERLPRINFMIGIFWLALMCLGGVWLIKCIIQLLGDVFINVKNYLKVFVNSTDKVIVVAMITGTVSIIGVVISSIFEKILDYRSRAELQSFCKISSRYYFRNKKLNPLVEAGKIKLTIPDKPTSSKQRYIWNDET